MASPSLTPPSLSCIPTWKLKLSGENSNPIVKYCSPWSAASDNVWDLLPQSLATWRPFPDTLPALLELKQRYQLAVISNVDDDLFASTAPQLKVSFNHVITAGQARCYKPCLEIFKMAVTRIGVPPAHMLHIGQSIYHDVIPAKSLGISTVWVNRPSPRPGAGA